VLLRENIYIPGKSSPPPLQNLYLQKIFTTTPPAAKSHPALHLENGNLKKVSALTLGNLYA
jgi:hypothetical protein